MNNKNKIIELIERNFSIFTLLVVIAFSLSFYIRGIMPYDATFRAGLISFAADDAVYHMRLAENLVANFPNKIWYDPFTQYPNGSILHFGPLWTYLIAIVSLILGTGSPSIELTRSVGAFLPPLFGALMVIPVYYIGRDILNRNTGILAAFMIAVMPGQFLNRSMLGFADHHIGEVFFSTLFIMYFIMAIKSVNFTTEDLYSKDFKKMEQTLLLSLFAGIAFALYMLQWSSGIFFGGIVSIYVMLQFIHDHKKDIAGITVVSTVAFFSASLLILIFFDPANGFNTHRYSYTHLAITLGASLFFVILALLSTILNKTKLPGFYYPLGLIALGASLIILAKLFIPKLYNVYQAFFSIFNVKTGGFSTIAEASAPTRDMIFYNFPGMLYHIALLTMFSMAVVLLLYRWSPERALFVTWCIIMFAMTTGQNRWFYYYSVNVAILCAFFITYTIRFAGFYALIDKIKEEVTDLENLHGYVKKNPYTSLMPVVVCILLLWTIFMPCFNAASASAPHGIVGGDYYQWNESLTWMRYNTPDPGLDFNAVYDHPSAGESFEYPDTAYGVMSWWDYGHVITYFGHRIPNANPFQAGIGGGPDHLPGASTFFTAQSEEDANKVLYDLGINDKPGSRYIVSNAYMAYAILGIMGVWDGHSWDNYMRRVVISGQEQSIQTEFWYTSMEGRLHIFDGSGLERYRLIHESAPNPYTRGGNEEQRCKSIYNVVYGGNIPVENTGYVKIFEFVEGATITGDAPIGATVTIYNNIATNQNRTFQYTQSTVAEDGTYSFIVPYSTLGHIEGETNFDTAPTGPYGIVIGDMIRLVDVSEEEILNGGVVT